MPRRSLLTRATGLRAPAVESPNERRGRRILLSAEVSAIARVVSILTTLVEIPVALRYLGSVRFGVWATLTSAVALLSSADLGLGNGLINLVAQSDAESDDEQARAYVSSAAGLLSAVAVILIVIGLLAANTLGLPRLLGARAIPQSELAGAVAAFILCFALNLPLSIAEKTQRGLQESHITAVWIIVVNVLQLLAILASVDLGLGLVGLVVAYTGALPLTSLANAVVLYGIQRPALAPRLLAMSKPAVVRLVRLGGSYFVVQIAATLMLATDPVILARLLGASAVTEYIIPARIFATVPALILVAAMPLWPAYTDALQRGERRWVRRTFILSMVGTFAITSVICTLLVIFGAPLCRLWVGRNVNPSMSLLVGLGVWTILTSTGTTLTMFLNGAHVLRIQVVIASLVGCVGIIFKVVFTQRYGLAGVVWGAVLAYIVCVALPYVVVISRLMRRFGLSRDLIN